MFTFSPKNSSFPKETKTYFKCFEESDSKDYKRFSEEIEKNDTEFELKLDLTNSSKPEAKTSDIIDESQQSAEQKEIVEEEIMKLEYLKKEIGKIKKSVIEDASKLVYSEDFVNMHAFK